MTIKDDDMFLVSRSSQTYKCPATQIAEYVASGFSGDVTIDGKTLTFTNGLLTNVS